MRRIGTIVLSLILVLLHQGKLVPYDSRENQVFDGMHSDELTPRLSVHRNTDV